MHLRSQADRRQLHAKSPRDIANDTAVMRAPSSASHKDEGSQLRYIALGKCPLQHAACVHACRCRPESDPTLQVYGAPFPLLAARFAYLCNPPSALRRTRKSLSTFRVAAYQECDQILTKRRVSMRLVPLPFLKLFRGNSVLKAATTMLLLCNRRCRL